MIEDQSKQNLNGPDRAVNTKVKATDTQNRLPHERDESPDAEVAANSGAASPLRDVIRQAACDLEQGLVDTDLRGVRGVEKVVEVPPQSAKPIRHTITRSASKG